MNVAAPAADTLIMPVLKTARYMKRGTGFPAIMQRAGGEGPQKDKDKDKDKGNDKEEGRKL